MGVRLQGRPPQASGDETMPSWLYSLLPQQKAAPSASSAHAWTKPAAMRAYVRDPPAGIGVADRLTSCRSVVGTVHPIATRALTRHPIERRRTRCTPRVSDARTVSFNGYGLPAV